MNIEIVKKMLNISDEMLKDDIIKEIIIYLRKSRKDSDYFKNEPIEKTLKRHEDQLQDWAMNIFGLKIPECNIFREVASGDTIEDRPVMQKVLNLIESDSVKAVLCIEIERLARGNTIDQGIIAQAFKYSNTKIITPYKIYDLDNEDDLIYFEDGLYQSRKYLLYTKKILKRGRIRSVREGKYIGSVSPYGYKRIKLINEKGYTLEFDEKEKKIVNLIANLFAYGINISYKLKSGDTVSSIAKIYSMTKSELLSCNPNSRFNEGELINIKCDMGTSAIANYLNYLNIKPRKNNIWTPNIIKNILTSPTIYGYVSWGNRETVTTVKNGEFIKYRPKNENCFYSKGKFVPIMSLDEERTQIILNKLKNNKIQRNPHSYDLKNPLSGLIVCPICMKKMIRRPYGDRNKKDTLYCKTARCSTVGSRLDFVEKGLINSLKKILEDYTNYIENYDIEYKKELNNSNNLKSIINNELKKVNAKLEKCYDFLEDGTYTKDVFNKRVDKLKLKIISLKERLKQLENIDIIKGYEERDKAIPILKNTIDYYDKCDTIKQKNELLCSIIDKVIYKKLKGGRGYEDKFDLDIILKI